ncbi:MAG: VCBS repeat-containing protein [Gemmatimonadetes bacterium]|nr:VCBS repeat-containing protein [Gemmatimonadota bacterium]
MPNELYRNPGNGGRFVDVAAAVGVADRGTTRQPSFIDFDNDGDVDLSVAFRDRPNALYRNDGDASPTWPRPSGIADPRKTVGSSGGTAEQDGDLDAFVASQDGDANALYRSDHFFRNAGDHFVNEMPVSIAADNGSHGVVWVDFDRDGDLDLALTNNHVKGAHPLFATNCHRRSPRVRCR